MTTIALRSNGKVQAKLNNSEATEPIEEKDPFAGVPRHVWQSLFILIATIRPAWHIDRIAHEVFWFRRSMPFPDLSAAAIRAAQDPTNKSTQDLHLAVLEAADKWIEANK